MADARPADGQRAPATGAVVALKALAGAKSRLAGLASPLRRRLTAAMAFDTLAALAPAVHRLLVISDEPALPTLLATAGIAAAVVPERSGSGLNAALRFGDELLRREGVELVLASVADLPALQTATVRRVLAAAEPFRRSFVADASGTGTTMLLAHGVPLDPHFQGGSAAIHWRSGAYPLVEPRCQALLDAQTDVDVVADLAAAVKLGVGPCTAALLGSVTERLAV